MAAQRHDSLERPDAGREPAEMDALTGLAVIAAWIALQYFVLPKFGVPT